MNRNTQNDTNWRGWWFIWVRMLGHKVTTVSAGETIRFDPEDHYVPTEWSRTCPSHHQRSMFVGQPENAIGYWDGE